jgi:hypothetical protein
MADHPEPEVIPIKANSGDCRPAAPHQCDPRELKGATFHIAQDADETPRSKRIFGIRPTHDISRRQLAEPPGVWCSAT